ncbi:hypothetical protein SAMN05216464_103262 [Mucilaginibacter pineti]|uniref:Phage integrase SAM-like domain-containing protein n=1 Tax=Mucilaginibacter pineti TaxID=1391627 RepID=A0A1G6Z986_9SPHI|nr:phage integrase SAM-like domain-containing protein [Mucilaginibacter pineti]SDD99032.1 hypothetical protein SAMN05216464_103262 [Mucilaginibacter pineti]
MVLKWLDDTLDDFRILIGSVGYRLEFFTCEQLRDYLQDNNKDIDIVAFANEHIDFLKSEQQNREPYSRTFRNIRNSLTDYFGRSQISINEIHSNMLYSYERFLKSPRTQIRINQFGNKVTTQEKGLSKGGLHAHMRDLRTLFNEAKRRYNNDELGIFRIKHYPFTRYKVGSPPASKSRSFDVEQVIIIRDTQVPKDSRIELARDLFMLSFYLCGTNAVDFYHATSANVINGRFEYKRSKTQGRRQDEAFISIKIVDEAKPLLEKYLGKLNTRYGAYDYLDYALYKGMKGLREITNLEELTLYWARHTFGTLARNDCRMSVDDIGEALNHIDNGHSTTDIYLAKDWGIVDDVQFQVITLIKHCEPNTIKFFNLNPIDSRKSMRVVTA